MCNGEKIKKIKYIFLHIIISLVHNNTWKQPKNEWLN